MKWYIEVVMRKIQNIPVSYSNNMIRCVVGNSFEIPLLICSKLIALLQCPIKASFISKRKKGVQQSNRNSTGNFVIVHEML